MNTMRGENGNRQGFEPVVLAKIRRRADYQGRNSEPNIFNIASVKK